MLRACRSLLLIAGIVGAFVGCRQDPAEEPADLPPVPQLDLSKATEDGRSSIESARQNVNQYPGDALANGELGMELHAHQLYKEAAVMYDRARKIHNVFRWEYYRAVVLSEVNDLPEARASFERALAINKDDPNALLGLAQLYFKNAATDPALQAEGEKTLEHLTQAHPDYIHGPLLRASRLEETGKLQEAIDVYKTLLEKGETFGSVHNALARLYGQIGDAQQAKRHEALALQSDRPAPPSENRWLAAIGELGVSRLGHAQRGQILYQNRMLARAAEEFELAVESEPANVDYRVNLVAIYGLLQQEEKAREHYQSALRLGGADAKVHLNMAAVLLANGKLDEAERTYNRAIAADGSLAKAYLGLARVAVQRQDHRAAEGHLRQAIAREPLNPVNHLELGRSLNAQGRSDEAIRALEEGVSYSEGRTAVQLLRSLAEIYEKKGDSAAAKMALERARVEATRSESNVDLALIKAQLASYQDGSTTSAAP